MTNQSLVRSGVGVIVCKEKKVLVGKRKGSHGEGVWAFPGGHIDPPDLSLKACGEREVREETGIICNVFSPDGYRDDLFTTYNILSEDGTRKYVTCYLVADYLAGGREDVMDVSLEHGAKIIPLEPEKCEGWYWKSIEELAKIVTCEQSRTWIPINQVIYYLNQLWKRQNG